jgi:hypothetical protein
MLEACKARRALDQRWLALSTFALGICRSVGRDAECSANCVVRACFISPYEKKQPTLSRTGERQKSVSQVESLIDDSLDGAGAPAAFGAAA